MVTRRTPEPAAPPRPPSSGRALGEKARELLLDELPARARELVEDFRRSDRFFKMRVAIIASWAALCLGTMWIACGPSSASNALGAEVQVNRDSLMGVQLLVRNESGNIWEDVVLTLDDGWQYHHAVMRPHDLIVLSMSSFKKGDEAPPRDYRPHTLVIRCEHGSDQIDLR